jgi:TRAP-type uncharacterized transport system fused permease subunit
MINFMQHKETRNWATVLIPVSMAIIGIVLIIANVSFWKNDAIIFAWGFLFLVAGVLLLSLESISETEVKFLWFSFKIKKEAKIED